jgi:hypothetical protein
MLLAIVNPLNESAYTFPILECNNGPQNGARRALLLG